MYKQLEIDKLVREDLIRCKELYSDMQNMMVTMPKDSLILRNKKYYHAYREGKKMHRIFIDNPHLLNQLKTKHFLKKGLQILKKRIAAGEAFLQVSQLYDPVAIASGFTDIYKDVELNHLFLHGDIDPETWKQENFERNSYEFKYEHYTANDIQVRSKAESMMGTQIEARGWLYICEPKLNFGIKIKYPDFAVMLPKTRKIVYIEHFGKMGEYSYVVDTMNKLVLYSMHGLHLGVNFFFTWESEFKPLNERDIADVLNKIEELDEL